MSSSARIADWQRMLATSMSKEAKLKIFREASFDVGLRIGDEIDKGAAVDRLIEIATAHGFFGSTETEIEGIIAAEIDRAEIERQDRADFDLVRVGREADAKRARANGKGPTNEPPISIVDLISMADVEPQP